MVALEEGGSPLPRGPLLALAGVFMTNSLSSTILLPFAAFMVDSFHVTDDRDKLGYYAGFLASSYSFGLLCSSIFWGILSDHIGRRPVLLFGLLSNLVCALSFGFSVNFQMAIWTRFFNGLLTGISGVGKTAVSEITNSSNQAAGFSIIGVCWGIGLLFGPALGGFLCQPVDKYPFIPIFHKGSLFDHFPYALPCMVLAVLTAVGFVIVFRYLPETKGLAKAAEDESLEERLVPLGGDAKPLKEGATRLEDADRLNLAEKDEGFHLSDDLEDGLSRGNQLEVIVDGSLPGNAEEGGVTKARTPGGRPSLDVKRRCCRGDAEKGDVLSSPQREGSLRRQQSGLPFQARSRRTSFEITTAAVESGVDGLEREESATRVKDSRNHNLSRVEKESISEDAVAVSEERPKHWRERVSQLRRWLVGKMGKQKEYQRLRSHDDSASGSNAPASSFFSRFFRAGKGQEDGGGLLKTMCEKEILVCLVIYCMLNFTFGAFDEIFPLWSLSDWHSGGLNFGTNNVGMAQTAGGVALIPFQLFAYPWLAKQLGPLNTMRVGMCSGFLLAFFPLIRLAGHDGALVQVAAGGAMMVRSVSSLCIFTSIFILLTNAVSDPQYLGGMNGIAASAAAVSRAVGPTAGGSVFAWSVGQHGIYPLDYHLPFVITGVILSATLGISILLPKSINERKFATV